MIGPPRAELSKVYLTENAELAFDWRNVRIRVCKYSVNLCELSVNGV